MIERPTQNLMTSPSRGTFPDEYCRGHYSLTEEESQAAVNVHNCMVHEDMLIVSPSFEIPTETTGVLLNGTGNVICCLIGYESQSSLTTPQQDPHADVTIPETPDNKNKSHECALVFYLLVCDNNC